MSSSMSNVRPSILLRPRKAASAGAISNATHMQLEHEREEARLAAKRDARAQREHVRGQQLWGSPEERAALAAQERAAHESQLQARRLLDERQRAEQERAAQDMAAHEYALRQAELAKIEAKKQYLAQLREDNYRLAQQRQHMQQYAREEEKTAASQSDREPGFLNKFGRHAY